MSDGKLPNTDSSFTDASIIDDNRLCKKVTHTDAEVVYAFHKTGAGLTVPTLTDGKWKLVKTDEAGSLAYPEINGLPDTGYNHDFTGADTLTFFDPA